MQRRIFSRVAVVLLWLVISTGIYQCSRTDTAKYDTAWTDGERQDNGTVKETQTEEAAEKRKLRVLIKTDHFAENLHEELIFSSADGMYIEQEKRIKSIAPGELFTVTSEELGEGRLRIRAYQNGRIRVHNVARAEEVSYRGSMECFGTKAGIALINELPIEEYLYGVVPSEMPASYPQEALKAQAISARTYTYFHMTAFAYPAFQAHMDDSTSFQVYQNIGEKEKVNQAVDDTKGQVITRGGEVIESFYYSTSGGRSPDCEAQKAEDFSYDKTQDTKEIAQKEQAYRIYITLGNVNDIECQEPWYRWEYVKDMKDASKLLERIEALSEKYADKVTLVRKNGKNCGLSQETAITSCQILQREASGMVRQLLLETENFRIIIETQHCIREALAKSGDTVSKNDGSQFLLGELLPSAYFYFDALYEEGCLTGMHIYGGGFGHGEGMSQNGAKRLAQSTASAEEILRYYYMDITIEDAKKIFFPEDL